MAATSASVVKRRVSMGTAAIVGLLAFAAGVVLAIAVSVEVDDDACGEGERTSRPRPLGGRPERR